MLALAVLHRRLRPLLDGGWPAHAAVLGWGPLDLFGCDRERPCLDHQGLLWLVNRGSVVDLHRNRESSKPPAARVVLAWELISCGR